MKTEKIKATTIRIEEDKLKLLRVIASLEGKSMNDIISELIDEYLKKYSEIEKKLLKKKRR